MNEQAKMNCQLLFCYCIMAIVITTHSDAMPLHASCKIKWNFGESCASVSSKIVGQMNTWKGSDCGTGERCLYTVTSSSPSKIEGTHKTPKKHYVDDLSFMLTASKNGCDVQGYSTSETWYAVLDYGTNYCNLHNLITGSGLDKVAGYQESTSNSVCTQYTSANCDKY